MKKLLLAFIFLFSLTPLFAISWNDFNFRISPEFSILHGDIYEHVFTVENTEQKQLSLLNWELKAIPVFGGTASLDFFKYGHVLFNIKAGIPCSTGNMQDYDWIASNQSYAGELTNYSIHDNLLKKYIQYSFEGGVNIPLPFLKFVITPVVGCEYEYIYFSGENGYYSYKTNNFKKKYYEGEVISYQQEYRTLTFGIKFAITPIDFLDLYADFYWAPFFNINDMDHHFKRSLIFYDQMKNGNMFRWNIKATYNFNTYNHAGFKTGIQYIPMVKGATFVKAFSSSQWGLVDTNEYLGGTSRFIFDFTVFYEVRF